MRRTLLIAVVLAVPVGAASAETKISTRYGVLEVVRGELFDILELSGEPVTDRNGNEIDVRFELRTSWQVGTEDIVLLAGWAGGNDVCAHSYRFITVTGPGARLTEPFARCSGTLIAARARETRIELELRSHNPRNDHIAVVFEGGTVTETAVPLQEVPAPMPGGGEEVTQWEGGHPIDVLRDPGERVRFLSIMPRAKLFDLMDRVAVSTGIKLRDGWIVATGCMAHQCGSEMGGFAIEVATGRAEALLYHDTSTPEAFGGSLDTLRPDLRTLALTGRLK